MLGEDYDSMMDYGLQEEVKEFETADFDELTSLAEEYIDKYSQPFYKWKVQAKYAYDEEPDIAAGDTVTVVSPKETALSRHHAYCKKSVASIQAWRWRCISIR